MTSTTALALVAALSATTAFAGGHANWTSVDAQSSVGFASIKNDSFGELHHFSAVTGTVSEAGALNIAIDLSSVETNIDIRNERMIEHVFQAGAATATLTGEIDMAEVSGLAVGDTALVDVEGTLAFVGIETDVETEMLVARLGEDRVLVTTADFILLSTEDLGIDAGIDKLMELASLDGITRVSPVSIRMVFEK
ncbi:YceI family protein [Roseobacter cerasinus]|nr:YceI family protein [Roseobacter cerasinus]